MGYLGKPEGGGGGGLHLYFLIFYFFILDGVVINENTNAILNFCLKFDQHFNIKSYNQEIRRNLVNYGENYAMIYPYDYILKKKSL